MVVPVATTWYLGAPFRVSSVIYTGGPAGPSDLVFRSEVWCRLFRATFVKFSQGFRARRPTPFD